MILLTNLDPVISFEVTQNGMFLVFPLVVKLGYLGNMLHWLCEYSNVHTLNYFYTRYYYLYGL